MKHETNLTSRKKRTEQNKTYDRQTQVMLLLLLHQMPYYQEDTEKNPPIDLFQDN